MRPLLLLSCALALGGCAIKGDVPLAEDTPVTSSYGVAQIGDAEVAAYVFCKDCGRPTKKTPALPQVARRITPSPVVPRPVTTAPASPPPVAVAAAEAIAPVVTAAEPVSMQVLFHPGSSRLDQDAIRVLEKALPVIGVSSVVVRGYTDDRGTDSLNVRLAKQRADAVAKWLGSHDIPMSRVDADGVGRCCYAAPNTTASGRRSNRRAVISISSPTRSLP